MNPTTKKNEQKTPLKELTYEQAFIELETIVAELESEEQTLEDALALFERGQALATHCTQLLDNAEIKVQQLSGDDLEELNVS